MMPDGDPGVFERTGTWLDEKKRKYGAEILSGVALGTTAFASVPKVAGGPIPWIAGGVVAAIFAAWLSIRGKESYAKITGERNDALSLASENARALRETVFPLAHNLNEYLELTEPHQRLSVYCHYDGEFRKLARVAKNPRYQSGGRAAYPGDQGVIGTVWERGNAIERIGKNESWEDWVSRFGFSQDQASKLNMKSKSIAAVRLDHNRNPVGVVLIESTNASGINTDHFEKLQASYISRSLSEVLSIAGPLIPDA